MRKGLILILSGVLLLSCGGGDSEKNLIEAGTMMSSAPVDTCLCDDLSEDSLGNYFKDERPYNGVCVYNYPQSNQKYMVKGIMNGKLHGKVIYYDNQGNVLVEEVYENGQKKRTGDGAPMTCDCAELEIKKMPGESIQRSFLEDIPFSGTCTKKFPESEQVYIESNYKNGLQEGYTSYYDKMGNTLYMEKYEHGELLKIIHQ